MSHERKRTALRAYRESDLDSLSITLDEKGVTEIVVKRWEWRRAYTARVRNFGRPDERIELDEVIEE